MSATAEMPPKSTASTDIVDQFKAITDLIKSEPSLAAPVINHITAKHVIYSLPAFYVSKSIPITAKAETFREIIKGLQAIIKGEPHNLLGSSASAQAAGPVAEVVPPAAAPVVRAPVIAAPVTKPKAPPAPPALADPEQETQLASAPSPVRKPQNDDPLTAQFRTIILQILGPITAHLEPEAIAKLVQESFDAALEEHKDTISENFTKIADGLLKRHNADAKSDVEKAIKTATDELRKLVDERLKNLPSGAARELHVNYRGHINKVEGVQHRQFAQIATWVAADVPVWLWGPAGGGKTTIGEQIATALGLPFYCVSIDETITVGKLVGFKNLSNGEYVEGLLYRAYKDGGLLMMDEMDTNSTAMAALNAMFANNHYTFGNGERVPRHKNFRVIAGANTKGTGAVAGFTARVRLDAATLDRFAVIELKYDWSMVQHLCGGKLEQEENPWRAKDPATAAGCEQWVRWVRTVSEQFGKSVLISPRAALLGVRALCAGVPVEEVAAALVFKLMDDATAQRVKTAHALPIVETQPVKEAA